MFNLNGYVKIHRRLVQWGWYKNSVIKDTFLHLIFTANFKDMEWEGQTIKRGQVVTSYKNLAADTGLTVQQVRNAIKKLKSTGEITSKSTNKYTIITLVNFDNYQSTEEITTSEITSKSTNKQQTNNKQRTNKEQQRKKDKNDKNDKNKTIEEILNEYTESEDLKNTIKNFIEMRKNIKAPMTTNALNLLLKKLNSMTSDDGTKIQILEQSILNSWKSIYELKGKEVKPQKTKFNNFEQAPFDYAEMERREREKIKQKLRSV